MPTDYKFPNKDINVVLVVKNDEGQVVRRELHSIGVSFELEVTEDDLGEMGGAEYIESGGLKGLADILDGPSLGRPKLAARLSRIGPGDIVPEVLPVVEKKVPKREGPVDVSEGGEPRTKCAFKRLPHPVLPAPEK